MDDRQTQIREGAGLEESKLNVEFIDWLRKWSTPIMGVVAVVALGFVVNSRLEKRRADAVDRAFEEFEAASGSATPSPVTLQTVAAENSGIRAVPILAEMQAADLYLKSARSGLKVGARPKPDGTFAPEEVLTTELRETNLADADRLYKKILDGVESDTKKAVHAMGAAYGVAAVAETRGDLDAAKQAYERVIKIAENSGLTGQAEVAKKRIEKLPTLTVAPKLLAVADLPKLPEPPKPAPDPTQPSGATAPTGEPGATGVFVPIEMPVVPVPAPTGAEPPKPEPPGAAPEAPKPVEPKPSEPK